MVEYKNWAAFAGSRTGSARWPEKMVGSEDKQVQMMTKRTEVREIVGTKTMQEIFLR